MFGKTKDITAGDPLGNEIDDFFGDEAAADHAVQLDVLRDRVQQVEGQIHSQFTSMAAYAQIAQEQVELARTESRAAVERSEQRLTHLIERERSDRLGSSSLGSGTAIPADVDGRLTLLEETVETIKVGIADCLSRQKALADAITALFEPQQRTLASGVPDLPPPTNEPIGELSLDN